VKILSFIILTPLLFFVITTIFRQSYNLLFFLLKKPVVWIVFVGMLGYLVFYLSSRMPQSLNIVWWASLAAFFDNIPPENKAMSKAEMDELSDEMLDIKDSRLKYRVGLASFAVGCVLGWIIFFGEALT